MADDGASRPSGPTLAGETDAEHQARLAQAGRLLAEVMHEVKNPLAVIQGYAQLLHDQCHVDADRTDLAAIIEETRRIEALVHDMLSFTRRVSDTIEEVDLSRVVQSCVNLMQNSMRQQSISVVASLPDQPVLVRGQHGAYVQVLLNLLDNARDGLASGRDEGRGIAIRTEQPAAAHRVDLIIANNGPPIPAETAEEIFTPFFTTKAEGEGTGLGLALSRDILRRYGGDIRLDANSATGGVAFRVQFPGFDS